MIRTILWTILIGVSVLWMPVWFQITLFIFAIVFLPYRLVLLIPAIFADALYATNTSLTLGHFKMTFLIGAMIVLWYVIVTQTRLTTTHVQHFKKTSK